MTKIGFIGVNENIYFFNRVVQSQFPNHQILIYYLANKVVSFLNSDFFVHVSGSATKKDDVQSFCDQVEYIVINQINFEARIWNEIKGIEKKLLPKIVTYLALDSKKRVKQLFEYLGIPTHQFYLCDSRAEFIATLPFAEYPMVIKKEKHYAKAPSVCYIPSQNDITSTNKAVQFIEKAKNVIIEKYALCYGNFTTIVWRSESGKNIIISNNICIYREGILLMVQPNYIKKPIYLQMVKIINLVLNKINQAGNYIFEFYELAKMRIILNNFKIGFNNVGNTDIWNYSESQYSYYIRHIFSDNLQLENEKINNLGCLLVVKDTYIGVKKFCESEKKFIFVDFFQSQKKNWDTYHALVLCNRAYRSHKQNRLLFKEIYKFHRPQAKVKNGA